MYFNICRRASGLKSDSIPTLLRVIQLQLKMGEVDQALNSIKSCLHSDPEHKGCKKQFKISKNLNKAIAKAEKAIERGKFREALGENALDFEKV